MNNAQAFARGHMDARDGRPDTETSTMYLRGYARGMEEKLEATQPSQAVSIVDALTIATNKWRP